MPRARIPGGCSDSAAIGGMIVMDDKWPSEVPSHWMVYFNVENVEQSAAKVIELGGSVIIPPFPAGPGICAVVQGLGCFIQLD